MKRLTLVLLLLAGSTAQGSSGSSYANRSGIFEFDDVEADYRLFLSASVFSGYKDIAHVSYAELPAFGPERGFWLRPDGETCVVVWSEATTNLWYWAGFMAPAEDNPRCAGRSRKELLELAAKEGVVKFYQGRIPRDLGERVLRAWQAAVFRDRPPAQALGLDGVIAVFGACDAHSNAAFWTVWCPPVGSKAAALMKIAHGMRRLVVEREDIELRAALLELDKANPQPAAVAPEPEKTALPEQDRQPAKQGP
ncbi:MAG TPA: hypothetical protein VK178_14020 [Opitutaceae bacterium]|nr:hypothetical protein [Opitutaceae bacterium]